MSTKKSTKKDYFIGSVIAGAVSAACLAGMKLIDKKMQKKKDKNN
jgi:hypothetical protein